MFDTLQQKIEALAKEIVGVAVKIHKELGSELLGSVYESCFCFELLERNIPFQRQVCIDIIYSDKLVINDALRIDILVNDEIIIELKAQENFHRVWEAQLLSYLKLSKKRLGFLLTSMFL